MNLVITVGPWTARVLADLFPTAQVPILMDSLTSSCNYLVVSTCALALGLLPCAPTKNVPTSLSAARLEV